MEKPGCHTSCEWLVSLTNLVIFKTKAFLNNILGSSDRFEKERALIGLQGKFVGTAWKCFTIGIFVSCSIGQ